MIGSILKHQHFDLLQKTVLERVVFEPPLKAASAMHNEACFLYAVNGESLLYGPSETQPLKSQDGVVMKCGTYLNNWVKCTDGNQCEAIAVHFYPEVLKLVYEDKLPSFLKNKSPSKPTEIARIDVDKMIKNYIETLKFYFESPTLVDEELVSLKVKELILLLYNTDTSGKVSEILGDLFSPDTYDFKSIIENHLYDPLSIDDLAILTSMSTSSFKRKFKDVFSDSPARYIKTKRLEKAANLLKGTNRRITEICFESGFNEIAHFSKSFASAYGCPPKIYRSKEQT